MSVSTLSEGNTSGGASDYLEFSSSDTSSTGILSSIPKRSLFYKTFRDDDTWSSVSSDSLWCTEYADDILSHLRRIEVNRKVIMYKSPQISHRSKLVTLIKTVAEDECLGRVTVHLAVYLLDVFMDTYKIIASKLNLVALVCLLIASKLEERDLKVPKMRRLNSYASDQYTRDDFKILERMILNFFKWTLLTPTTATFLESLANKVLIPEELQNSNHQEGSSSSDLNFTCNNLVFEFLDLSLNDRRLFHVKPSRLAAACLAAARKELGITPTWPYHLESLTRYSYDFIEEYIDALIALRDTESAKSTDRIKKTPDYGYITDTDSHDDEFNSCAVPAKRRRL